MKVLLDVLDDKPLSELLMKMGINENYGLNLLKQYTFPKEHSNKPLSKNVKTHMTITQATLSRQLGRLYKEGYLNRRREEKQNKIYFSIKWNKIIEGFIKYSIKYFEKQLIESQAHFKGKKEYFQIDTEKYITQTQFLIHTFKDKEVMSGFIHNKYVIEMMKQLFSILNEFYSDEENPQITINEIYHQIIERGLILNIINSLLARNHDLVEIFKKNKEFESFNNFCNHYKNVYLYYQQKNFIDYTFNELIPQVFIKMLKS